MLLLLRKVLFYILLAVFLVITPYLILYGLGYGFNPEQGEIYKTGLISIASEPKGASIYIEGRKYSRKTPAIIRGLLPGDYKVRVSKKGFETWRKQVQIFPEKATRLDPVILLPAKPEVETLSTGPYENLFSAAGDYKLFGITGSHLADLRRTDLLFNKETAEEKDISALSGFEIKDWTIKKDSDVVLFKGGSGKKQGYVLYDLEKGKKIKDLTGLLPDGAEHIDWNRKKIRTVYFMNKGGLFGLGIERGKVFPVLDSGVLGYGISRNKIWILKNDFSLWQSDLKGEVLSSSGDKDGIAPAIFSGASAGFYKIEILRRELFQKELILFWGDDGSLRSNWLPYRLVDKGVLGYRHISAGDLEKILYWTAHEIGIFDFSLGSDEEENMPPRLILYRSGTSIQQAFWAFDNTHILFQDKNELFLLEAAAPPPYLMRAVQTIAVNTDAIYNERQRAVYFLNFENKRIMKRKLTE